MKKLIQTDWFTKKEITIRDNGLSVKTKDLKENLEYKIKFEELGFDRHYPSNCVSMILVKLKFNSVFKNNHKMV